MADLVQGKNEYLYFFIQRKLENVGSDTTITSKKFTVNKFPIANSALDGVTIAAKDVQCFEGDALRTNLVSIPVSAVNAKTGEITLTNSITAKKNVYCTYWYEYGNVAYATEYSATTTLNTKDITPVSSPSALTLETDYKYEGSIKMYDDTDLENALMLGVDQTDDTVGGKLARSAQIPAPSHHCITKKIRGTAVSYQAFQNFKMNSLEDATKGGDLREKSFKFNMDDLIRSYTPPTGSIML
jgi:hypothetical protein